MQLQKNTLLLSYIQYNTLGQSLGPRQADCVVNCAPDSVNNRKNHYKRYVHAYCYQHANVVHQTEDAENRFRHQVNRR